ncbi:Hypothetical protein DEACI_2817 [Acididesulfobacillus acetoxydans]|uniref:Uncharacterized protein n=1 Tax=Acididesulfobacillus acetoxydans TaxID=1561005 RepID=A0A8S0Y3J8_9FIRM|nr:hypothetical protein [Acididesulfobacillus acetoxydans]CAA7602145.1 Hypothetical protein DEACI_2817 [Acididesulfobacillus acetoxydans]CEJ08012.1 Hypothetical protein DEACI_2487 [Acididesulfobacillus acetoxydans]
MKLPRFALVGVLTLAVTVAAAGVAAASTGVPNLPGQNAASVSPPVVHAGPQKSQHFKRDCPFVLGAVAGILGVQPQELKTELQGGKSLKDVAAAKGMDSATLAGKLQAAWAEKIDSAVKSGRLEAQKAEATKAKLSARIESVISKPWECKGTGSSQAQRTPFSAARHAGMFRGMRDQVQSLLGLDSVQLKAALEGGKSLAQLAQEKGIAQKTLESKIRETLSANLDQAVRDGKLSPEAAAQVKADLPQWVKMMVTGEHSGRRNS